MKTVLGQKQFGWLTTRWLTTRWLAMGSGVVCLGAAVAGYLNLPPLIRSSNGSFQLSMWYLVLGVGLLTLAWSLLSRLVSNPLISRFLNWCWGWSMISLGFMLISSLFISRFLGHDWGVLPLYAGFNLSPLSYKLLIPLIIGGITIGLIPYLLRAKFHYFLLLLIISAYALALTVAAMDAPLPQALVQGLNRPPHNYFAVLPLLNQELLLNYADYMDRFKFIFSHPPLSLIFLWALYALGLSKFQLALVVTAFGSLTIIPLYLLCRRLYGKQAAQVASLVFIFIPSVVLYSATSLDVVYMFCCTWCLLYFFKAIEGKRRVDGIIWGLWFTICLGLTFVSGLLLALFGLLILIQQRYLGKIEHLWAKLGLMGGALLGLHLLLWLVFNYNIVKVFINAFAINLNLAATHRSYLYWVWGNLGEYGIFLGIPLLALISLYIGQSRGPKKNSPQRGYYFGEQFCPCY